MFEAAIFDLDGVIVDTVPIHFRAWKKMFAEYGLDFSFEDYKAKVDGISRYDGAKAILTGLSDKEIAAAGDKKQSYFLEFISKEKIPVYPSVLSLIGEMKGCNKRVAFASSSRNCRKILEKVGVLELGDAVVDGSEITRSKPDPQIFLLAAERLNCKPKDCVVFEDAVLGVEAALNARMLCVGIDHYNKPERLKGAHLIVGGLSELDCERIERLFQ